MSDICPDGHTPELSRVEYRDGLLLVPCRYCKAIGRLCGDVEFDDTQE